MHLFLNELAGMVERLPWGADIGGKARKELEKPTNMFFGNYGHTHGLLREFIFRAKLKRGVEEGRVRALFEEHAERLEKGGHQIKAFHDKGIIQLKVRVPAEKRGYYLGLYPVSFVGIFRGKCTFLCIALFFAFLRGKFDIFCLEN
ncbi:hypothetical protein HZC09_05990 [Candidatus Micrarchaeota archaeon]|nr:hypothetical protein [Candidatus Micrarchaeota archaeon]